MAIEFAQRMEQLNSSEIRDLLKLTQVPDIISFAGGLPAPELFPVEEIEKVTSMVLKEQGKKVLQYATTEGYAPLRKKIAERMNQKFSTNVMENDILVTTGSQQGLDFTAKIFINKGDVILCESPSYLGALSAFKAYEPKFVEIPTDDNGIIIEELDKILASTPNVKFIYVIPDFQNPTGRTWPMERRIGFMDLINKYEIPAIEDNPYGELRFEGEILPSLKSMDTKGLVVFLGTFSKTFCPGLRVGWVAADKNLLEKYIIVKQGADLHSSTLTQCQIDKYMDVYDLDAHVVKLVALYRGRRDLIIKTMREEFPSNVKFTNPAGGLFTWVELPEHINARDILLKSIEQKVAFVPGGAFYPNGGHENALRINYSNMPEDKIVEGIKKLGAVLKASI